MKKYFSSLILLIAPLLWGIAFSMQKEAVALSAFTIGSIRSLFATVFLFAVIPLLDKFSKNGRRLIGAKKILDFTKAELIGGALCGIVLVIASAFQQSGIGEGTDAGKSAFITALYVVIVPIIYLVMGKKSPINVWISIGIAVLGFYLLCIKESMTILFSDLLVLICALIFALHIIVIDRFSLKSDGVRLSCVQFFVAFILNSVLALIFESPLDFALIGMNIDSLLYLGICSSGIAYTLQIIGQKNTPPALASIILSLESVFGVIFASIIHGERMSIREYIGCAIVFFAVTISQIDFRALLLRSEKHYNDNKS